MPHPPATGSDILPESDGNVLMQYVVSDRESDVGDGTQVTTAVTLNARNTAGFVALVFPGD